ncbi:hypothetical protein OYT13_15975 [Pandoraea sp. XJJ-1]|uniref:hypothetical protein n=1 Tax=Pandoraea sp. XJJ-1 TaxID=3002643 RepID=UPI002282BE1F|nr:hypothetical protein [Pandoraea sp. XJJ-1]WAL81349.1 hypothetical protein OYT13_15975 [Pandoraea sp. XJJ-1]
MPDHKTVTFDVRMRQDFDEARAKALNVDWYTWQIAYSAAAPTPAAPGAGQEAVAEVCSDYELRWVGTKPIAEIVRATGIKVGDKLYPAPVNASEPVAERCARFAELYRDEHASGKCCEETCNEIARACRDYAAPVNGGTQGLWDVYAFNKWRRRVSAPIAWDAHTVYLDMVANGWSKDIELRNVSAENYSAPVNGGERDSDDSHLRAIMERDAWRNAMVGLCNGRDWPTTPDEAADHLRKRLHPERAADAPQSFLGKWSDTIKQMPMGTADAPQVGAGITKNLDKYGYCIGCSCRDDELDPCLGAHKEQQAALSSPAKVGDINAVGNLLREAWEAAEPDHPVTLHPQSYISTFADMARAIIAVYGVPANVGDNERMAFNKWFGEIGFTKYRHNMFTAWKAGRAALSADGGDELARLRTQVIELNEALHVADLANDALQDDAQRLEFMGHHGASIHNEPPPSSGWYVVIPYRTGTVADDYPRFSTAREAIDAARAAIAAKAKGKSDE